MSPQTCTNCGSELAPGKSFCTTCGTAVPAASTCANCGSELAPGKSFCTACGTAVAAAPTCSKCGSELAAGKSFCATCGTAVAGAPAPAKAGAVPSPKETPRRGRRRLWVGGGCLSLLACTCLALFVLGSLPSVTDEATVGSVETSQPAKAAVKPVQTSQPAKASKPAGVKSERELTPEELFQRVEGDERFAEVYDLASQQGYTQAEEGVEATMSDGSEVVVLPLSSPQGETIAAFRVKAGERRNSLLARLDGEAVVLYDREGRAEITEEGVKVFDAAGKPIALKGLQPSSRAPGLSAPLQGRCTGGDWDDLNHCVSGTTAAGCAVGLAACLGTPWSLGVAGPVCLVGVVTACPWALPCVSRMNTDDPPTVEVKTEPLELDTPCEPECYFDNSMAEWGVLIRRPRYRFQIDIDDDRPPRPQSPRYIEVCAGQGKTRLVPEAEDCLGQIMPFSVTAPDLASWRSFLRMCPEGQFCEDAECRPREAPEPPPPEEIDEGVGEEVPESAGPDEEVPESEELDDPLPVEIVSFEAETPSPKVKRGQCVEVTWEAPGATNVYIIEIDSLGIETKRWHNLPASGKDCLYPDEMPRGQNVFWRLYAWGVADDAWVESWPIVVELE